MKSEIEPLSAPETQENRMDDVTHLLSEKQRIWIELHAATQDAYCSWVPRWRWILYRKQQPNLDCIESLKVINTLRTQLKSVEAERDRYRVALNRLLVGDHVGTPINRGCGAMSVIEDALSWTDSEVEQFMKEWDEGKHKLSPEDEGALEASKAKLFQRIKFTSETDH